MYILNLYIICGILIFITFGGLYLIANNKYKNWSDFKYFIVLFLVCLIWPLFVYFIVKNKGIKS